MNRMYDESETQDEVTQKMKKNKIVREFWELFPQKKQSEISLWGLLKYDDILVVDEKGDVLNKLIQVHAEFKYSNSPFSRIIHTRGEGYNQIIFEKEEFKRVQIFPEVIPEYEPRKIYQGKYVSVNQKTFHLFREDGQLKALYDIDGRYEFLEQRDIIKLRNTQNENESMLIKITNRYSIKLSEYLQETFNHQYRQEVIKNQIEEDLKEDSTINVYEFVWTFRDE